MKRALVLSPTGRPLPLSRDTLLDAAEDRWNGHVREPQPNPDLKVAATLQVDPPGETGFTIDLAEGYSSLSCDGTPDQNITVAAWVRSLMPEDLDRVIVADQAWTMHAELPHGVTAEEIKANIVDHSVPGWNENDPDLQS